MKFFITAFALVAVSSADVSHLNNEYLPPHQHVEAHHHTEYAPQPPPSPPHEHTSHGVISQKVTSVYGIGQAGASAHSQIINRFDVPAEEHHHHEEHQAYQDVTLPIGADTYTPAHSLEESQDAATVIGANTYTPAHLTEEHHHQEEDQDIPFPIGADSYAPAQYAEDNQDIPAAIGADTYTPAHLVEQHHEAQHAVQEFDVNNHAPVVVYGDQQAVQEFDAGNHAPVVVYGDQPSQSYSPQYQTQQESHVYEDVSNAVDTKYGSNGGYIY